MVVIYDIVPENFEKIKEDLNRIVREKDRMASVGYAYGNDRTAMELVQRAETEMYADKNLYYKETGRDRRRR